MRRFGTFLLTVMYLVAFITGEAAAAMSILHFYVPGRKAVTDRESLSGIVRQQTDETCGPAAIATILAEYFYEDVTEHDLYVSALRAMLGDAYLHVEWPVVTFRGLIGALADRGYQGFAIQTDLAGLKHYFAQHPVPAILQIFYPTPHFTVVLGYVDGFFVLADPSLGHVVLTESELAEYWRGYTLLIQAPAGKPFASDVLRQRLDEVTARTGLLRSYRSWL